MKTTLPRVIADRGREGAGDVKLVAFEKCWESGRVREATWVWEGEGERERLECQGVDSCWEGDTTIVCAIFL